MSRFNTLYMGSPSDAADALEAGQATEQELRAALQNALRRVGNLTDELDTLREELRAHIASTS